MNSHLGVAVAGANRNDHRLVQATLDSTPEGAPAPSPAIEHGLWLDKGYDYDAVYGVVRRNGLVPHIVPRATEREWLARIPGYRARRWPVERTHRWRNRFRRILVRWEKQGENYTAMLHLSWAFIAFKQAGLALRDRFLERVYERSVRAIRWSNRWIIASWMKVSLTAGSRS